VRRREMLYPSDNPPNWVHGHPWLDEQYAYQAQTFGINYAAMADDPEELTSYVVMNLTAAQLEVAEAFQEVPWKPWATVDKGEVWAANRDRFVGEVVDVLFFLANALTAVGVTDQELAERYAAKMAVNRERQATDYDGKSTKCAQCTRALDEPGVTPLLNVDGKPTFCGEVCRVECERLNREVLHGLGFNDVRIDGIMANKDRTQL
jgi:hypothetical protein